MMYAVVVAITRNILSDIYSLYESGMSYLDISLELDCSRTTVERHLKKALENGTLVKRVVKQKIGRRGPAWRGM